MIELLITLLMGCTDTNLSDDQIALFHTLSIEAPETLEEPTPDLFMSYAHYQRAARQYKLMDHWATPHYGITLKCRK